MDQRLVAGIVMTVIGSLLLIAWLIVAAVKPAECARYRASPTWSGCQIASVVCYIVAAILIVAGVILIALYARRSMRRRRDGYEALDAERGLRTGPPKRRSSGKNEKKVREHKEGPSQKKQRVYDDYDEEDNDDVVMKQAPFRDDELEPWGTENPDILRFPIDPRRMSWGDTYALWDRFLMGLAFATKTRRGLRPFGPGVAKGFTLEAMRQAIAIRFRQFGFEVEIATSLKADGTQDVQDVRIDDRIIAQGKDWGLLAASNHPEDMTHPANTITLDEVRERDPKAHLRLLLNLTLETMTAMDVTPELRDAEEGELMTKLPRVRNTRSQRARRRLRVAWFELVMTIRAVLAVNNMDEFRPLGLRLGEAREHRQLVRPLRTVTALLEDVFRDLLAEHKEEADTIRAAKHGPLALFYYEYCTKMGIVFDRQGSESFGTWIAGEPDLAQGVPVPGFRHPALLAAEAEDLRLAVAGDGGRGPGPTALDWPQGTPTTVWGRYSKLLSETTLRPRGATPLQLQDVSINVLANVLGINHKGHTVRMLVATDEPGEANIVDIKVRTDADDGEPSVSRTLLDTPMGDRAFVVLPRLKHNDFSRLMYLNNLCVDLAARGGSSQLIKVWLMIKLLAAFYNEYMQFAPFQLGSHPNRISRAEADKPLITLVNLLREEVKAAGLVNEPHMVFTMPNPADTGETGRLYREFLTREMQMNLSPPGTAGATQLGAFASNWYDDLIDGTPRVLVNGRRL